MNFRRLPFHLCLLALVACTNGAQPGEEPGDGAGAAGGDPDTERSMDAEPASPNDPAPAVDYAGPEVDATLGDAARSVDVVVEAPTGGHELAVDDVAMDGGVATVRVRLTTPGDEEMVTQAFETLRATAELPRAASRVIVRVATWKRGVEYLVPPEAKVAAVVEP